MREPSLNSNAPWLARATLPVVMSCLLGACAVQAPPQPSQTAVPATWHSAPPPAAAGPLADWLQAADPTLRFLLDAVQSQSPSLQQAVARRDEVRALAGMDPGGPRAQGLLQLQRTRPVQPAGSQAMTQGLAQFDASWELDLFARVRQQSRALAQRAEAAQWELQAVRLSLMVEVAQLYLGLRSAEQAQALAQEEEQITERLAAQAAQRQRAGLETPAQQALLAGAAAETRQRRLAQQLELDTLVKALVAATGLDETALRAQLSAGRARLPALPAFALPTVPAEALQQRPDLIAARAQALAAWKN